MELFMAFARPRKINNWVVGWFVSSFTVSLWFFFRLFLEVMLIGWRNFLWNWAKSSDGSVKRLLKGQLSSIFGEQDYCFEGIGSLERRFQGKKSWKSMKKNLRSYPRLCSFKSRVLKRFSDLFVLKNYSNCCWFLQIFSQKWF